MFAVVVCSECWQLSCAVNVRSCRMQMRSRSTSTASIFDAPDTYSASLPTGVSFHQTGVFRITGDRRYDSRLEAAKVCRRKEQVNLYLLLQNVHFAATTLNTFAAAAKTRGSFSATKINFAATKTCLALAAAIVLKFCSYQRNQWRHRLGCEF